MMTGYRTTTTCRSRTPAEGRKALLALAKLVCLVLFLIAALAGVGARVWSIYDRLHVSGWTSYTVQPGDTLATIAEHTDPQDYMPAVVQEIKQHNGIVGDDDTIWPGQVIQVPSVKG